ncbi:MAG: thermonuclease family protein [Parvularculaceae bacterium]|nr:thermonuclease family protein [Parvularculaceae bacterium]
MSLWPLAIMALFAPAHASALAGPVAATVERVIDGDTFKARAAIWIDQEIVISVRLAEVDTPELARAACPAEKARAEEAQSFTAAFLAGRAILTDIRHDKFAGRVVARVANVAGDDLGEALLRRGLAARGAGADWCPAS